MNSNTGIEEMDAPKPKLKLQKTSYKSSSQFKMALTE